MRKKVSTAKKQKISGKAWIVTVNMGYGHQRTSYPLKHLSPDGKIFIANDYPGIPARDRKIWESQRKAYEFVSAFKRVPIIGQLAFYILDRFQRILSFYPRRDLSRPSFQLKQSYYLIKKDWGKHLIEALQSKEKPLPFISTFFVPAFMADHFNYPGDIFCVVCDADISRAWAPLIPQKSKIKYFAPNERTAERLKLYGVKSENIFLTGYPLPLENIGTKKMEKLKEDLGYRLFNLDPQKRFFRYYEPLIKKHLGSLPEKPNHPLTIMFAVGGAGAQKEIGVKIVKTLAKETGGKFKNERVKIILVAGIKKEIKEFFESRARGLNAEVIFGENIEDYFEKFNQALRKTDILWTKPSELSFYSAFGLPIIIAPPIGSQEEFNRRWLLKSGFGLSQEDPSHLHQWLFDWLNQGYLAEAAMQGFVEGEKLGTIKIKEIIKGRRDKSLLPLSSQISGLIK